MSSASAAHTSPTVGQIVDGLSASELHNEASRLKSAGDLEGAERMYLQAIADKEASLGTDHFVTATSYDGLGEVYLAMQRPAKAEEAATSTRLCMSASARVSRAILR
ncbi:hypothetical protein K466DRAFT_5019 [Polyporus arcularius HHB13444]|uniref:Tetratricopeptide repeat protein n=1 Tax=Polyporus arcularius HHB13444 TaxID=1314778 RepID=A0A5C3PZ99_9APHY|nr:hypothetical protein K466DRAFT_5019 [Polyporus arcularius HHB13444]